MSARFSLAFLIRKLAAWRPSGRRLAREAPGASSPLEDAVRREEQRRGRRET